MSSHREHKVRVSIDCTEDERMYIKMLAARSHMTISEYLLSFARKEMPTYKQKYEPNVETQRALKEVAEESGEVYESIDDFWKAIGMNPNAED